MDKMNKRTRSYCGSEFTVGKTPRQLKNFTKHRRECQYKYNQDKAQQKLNNVEARIDANAVDALLDGLQASGAYHPESIVRAIKILINREEY